MNEKNTQNNIKSINTLMKYALKSDLRWDVFDYKFQELVNTLSDNDKNIIKDLFYIGDGELSGTAMIFEFMTLAKASKEEALFAESLLYGSNVIVYDEFRHGMILKELNSNLDNKSYFDNVEGKELQHYIFADTSPWKTPYEILVSFFLGEIINSELYFDVAKHIENHTLKDIVINIAKDEVRHKKAWFELSKNLCNTSEEAKEKYFEAVKQAHFIHQAEVGDNYEKGAFSVQKYYQKETVNKINQQKYSMLKEILGDTLTLTEKEMRIQYTLSIANHYKEYKQLLNKEN
jgi:rubrerythrin